MMLSREHKLGYCGVAKAGSSSVHSHFLALANETADRMDNNDMRKKARDIYGWRGGLSAKDFLEAAARKEIVTFFFVRHPLER